MIEITITSKSINLTLNRFINSVKSLGNIFKGMNKLEVSFSLPNDKKYATWYCSKLRWLEDLVINGTIKYKEADGKVFDLVREPLHRVTGHLRPSVRRTVR